MGSVAGVTTARRTLEASGGFTLVEMILSMGIIMVILGATYSVMLLASKAVPNPGSPLTCTLEGARALDRLVGDLTYATGIVDVKPGSITFTVPDRTGDTVHETLKYSWSGVSGAPLIFSINGSAGGAIADDVREFALVQRQGTRVPAPVYTWGGETQLSSYTSLVNLGAGLVTSTNWYATQILPALASDARSWRITRVRIPVRANAAIDGQAFVQVRSAQGGLPTSTVLDQATLTENALGAGYSWATFQLNNAPATASNVALCVVVQWGSGATACDIQYQNVLYLGNNPVLVTTNGGTSWTGVSGQSMLYEVYGQVATIQQGPGQAILEGVECSIRVGASASSRVKLPAALLNQPVAP